MSNRFFSVALICAFFLGGCINSRVTTHWIVNNNSNSDVALQLAVHSAGSKNVHRTSRHIIKPGLQQIYSKTFAHGTYLVEVGDGVSGTYSKQVRFDNENWVMINYINNDSAQIRAQYGMVDTVNLKKINGRFTGIDIINESHKPPFLYTLEKK